MAARTKSYVTPKYKTKHRVKNWPAYEAGLRKRGDVMVWFDEACADSWNAPSSGLPGGQRRYSDLAIVTALTLRTVLHLALRQAEGFEQRDAAIGRIAEVGRRRWCKESGAHRQARAENTMFRYKRLVGDGLRAKRPGAQATEARIAVNVLNRMHGLGTPESEAVVA
jgi:hypothetical protein